MPQDWFSQYSKTSKTPAPAANDWFTQHSKTGVVEKRPGTLASAWDWAMAPLTTVVGDTMKRGAQWATDPNNAEQFSSFMGAQSPFLGLLAKSGYGRGLMAGMGEGVGDIADSMTSPFGIATAGVGGLEYGAGKLGLGATARALGYGTKAMGVPVAAHGAYNTIRPDATMAERFGGIGELAGGAAMALHTPFKPAPPAPPANPATNIPPPVNRGVPPPPGSPPPPPPGAPPITPNNPIAAAMAAEQAAANAAPPATPIVKAQKPVKTARVKKPTATTIQDPATGNIVDAAQAAAATKYQVGQEVSVHASGWPEKGVVTGVLPNGDYVVNVKGKVSNYVPDVIGDVGELPAVDTSVVKKPIEEVYDEAPEAPVRKPTIPFKPKGVAIPYVPDTPAVAPVAPVSAVPELPTVEPVTAPPVQTTITKPRPPKKAVVEEPKLPKTEAPPPEELARRAEERLSTEARKRYPDADFSPEFKAANPDLADQFSYVRGVAGENISIKLKNGEQRMFKAGDTVGITDASKWKELPTTEKLPTATERRYPDELPQGEGTFKLDAEGKFVPDEEFNAKHKAAREAEAAARKTTSQPTMLERLKARGKTKELPEVDTSVVKEPEVLSSKSQMDKILADNGSIVNDELLSADVAADSFLNGRGGDPMEYREYAIRHLEKIKESGFSGLLPHELKIYDSILDKLDNGSVGIKKLRRNAEVSPAGLDTTAEPSSKNLKPVGASSVADRELPKVDTSVVEPVKPSEAAKRALELAKQKVNAKFEGVPDVDTSVVPETKALPDVDTTVVEPPKPAAPSGFQPKVNVKLAGNQDMAMRAFEASAKRYGSYASAEELQKHADLFNSLDKTDQIWTYDKAGETPPVSINDAIKSGKVIYDAEGTPINAKTGQPTEVTRVLKRPVKKETAPKVAKPKPVKVDKSVKVDTSVVDPNIVVDENNPAYKAAKSELFAKYMADDTIDLEMEMKKLNEKFGVKASEVSSEWTPEEPPRGAPDSPERMKHIAWEHGKTWREKLAKLDKIIEKSVDGEPIDWDADWEPDTTVRSIKQAETEINHFKEREQAAKLKAATAEKVLPEVEMPKNTPTNFPTRGSLALQPDFEPEPVVQRPNVVEKPTTGEDKTPKASAGGSGNTTQTGATSGGTTPPTKSTKKGGGGTGGTNPPNTPPKKKAPLLAKIIGTVKDNLTGKAKFKQFVEANPKFKEIMDTLIKSRSTQKMISEDVRTKFKHLADSKPADIVKFQKEMEHGQHPEVRKFFDDMHDMLTKAGIEVEYKKGYLPQEWADSAEEVANAIKSLGRNRQINKTASFQMKSRFLDYEQGINKGKLTPQSGILDLMDTYAKRANKLMADRAAIDALYKSGYVTKRKIVPEGYQLLDPNLSTYGRFRDKPVLKAHPAIKEVLENYLKDNSDSIYSDVADKSGKVANLMMSSGVWKKKPLFTARGFSIANPFGGGRAFQEGGFKRYWQAIKAGLNPEKAGASMLSENAERQWAARNHGWSENTAELQKSYEGFFDNPNGGSFTGTERWKNPINKLSKWQHEAFEKPLNEQMIPKLKWEAWKDSYAEGIKKGLTDKQAGARATKWADKFYSGENLDLLYNSKEFNTGLRLMFLSPRWLKTNLRIGSDIASAMNPMSNMSKLDRKKNLGVLGKVFGVYVGANLLQKAMTGKFMVENDAGHKFEFEAGTDANGKPRRIKIFSGSADWLELPGEMAGAAVDVAKGNEIASPAAEVSHFFGNRLSIPLATGASIYSGQDYKGRKNVFSTVGAYGQPTPWGGTEGKIANTLAQLIAYGPPIVSNPLNYAAGRSGLEEALARIGELPVNYGKAKKNPFEFKPPKPPEYKYPKRR